MQTEQKEIISPEGVEERVVEEFTYRITLTGGGRYRIYSIKGETCVPMKTTTTKEEALKEVGSVMAMTGAFIVNPADTLKLMLDTMKNKGG